MNSGQGKNAIDLAIYLAYNKWMMEARHKRKQLRCYAEMIECTYDLNRVDLCVRISPPHLGRARHYQFRLVKHGN